MIILKTAPEYNAWRKQNKGSVGFVPTLGALHNGHFSLVKKSLNLCNITVVSIFLNPTQFSPNEDLESYPNTLNEDIKYLQNLGVDVLFLPNYNEMYKNVQEVSIPPSKLFDRLEGKSRPHFFYGVTTIVAKLFNVIIPTHTFFGEKDAQQLRIIKQMINTMKYPLQLIACPTVRDKNGLALSSRNHYLTETEKKIASIIYRSLKHIAVGLSKNHNIKQLKQDFCDTISINPNMSVDYISIANSDTLEEINILDNQEVLISTAVFFNTVRLIDNITFHSST
tara:strand:- start:286 stop:1128 length:843 start_codon:yes stop_codon:yes gene_type:complete